jgi:hypothetical protein
MRECTQTTITDGAFQHVPNLVDLNMTGCYQSTITDAAFRYLPRVKKKIIGYIRITMTDEALFQCT